MPCSFISLIQPFVVIYNVSANLGSSPNLLSVEFPFPITYKLIRHDTCALRLDFALYRPVKGWHIAHDVSPLFSRSIWSNQWRIVFIPWVISDFNTFSGIWKSLIYCRSVDHFLHARSSRFCVTSHLVFFPNVRFHPPTWRWQTYIAWCKGRNSSPTLRRREYFG